MFNKYRTFSLAILLSCFVLPFSYAGKTGVEPITSDEEDKNSSIKQKKKKKKEKEKGNTDTELDFLMNLPIEIFSLIVDMLRDEKTEKSIKAIGCLKCSSKYCSAVVDDEVRFALDRAEKNIKEADDYPPNHRLSLYFHLNQASLQTDPGAVVPHYIAAMRLDENYGSRLATQRFFRFVHNNNLNLGRSLGYLLSFAEESDVVIKNLTSHMHYLLDMWKKDRTTPQAEKNLFKFYWISRSTSLLDEFQNVYATSPFAEIQVSNPCVNASPSTLWNLFKYSTRYFDFQDQDFWDSYATYVGEHKLHLLANAAEKGHAKAQFYLGKLYHLGFIVDQDFKEANRLFRLAADQGHTESQYCLGSLHYNGQGVEQDFVEAAKLFRSAATQGHANSQYRLGGMYCFGIGVDEDYGEAAKLFKKAADQAHAEARNILGWLYEYGLGVPQSFEDAAKEYRKASEQGHQFSTLDLAYFYRNGLGVPVDLNWAAKLEEPIDSETVEKWKKTR